MMNSLTNLRRLGKRLAVRAGRGVVLAIDGQLDCQLRERGMLSAAFEFAKINGVTGDYFEFGLWRGKTFLAAARLKRRFRFESMLLWGFDSFAGLPAID